MAYKVKVGSTWKDAKKTYVKVGSSWKPTKKMFVKVGSAWKQIWVNPTHYLTVGKGLYGGVDVFGYNNEPEYYGGTFGSLASKTINGVLCDRLVAHDDPEETPVIKLETNSTINRIQIETDKGVVFVFEGSRNYYYLSSNNTTALISFLKENHGKTVGLSITST